MHEWITSDSGFAISFDRLFIDFTAFPRYQVKPSAIQVTMSSLESAPPELDQNNGWNAHLLHTDSTLLLDIADVPLLGDICG